MGFGFQRIVEAPDCTAMSGAITIRGIN